VREPLWWIKRDIRAQLNPTISLKINRVLAYIMLALAGVRHINTKQKLLVKGLITGTSAWGKHQRVADYL
jgi:hypothetical protein